MVKIPLIGAGILYVVLGCIHAGRVEAAPDGPYQTTPSAPSPQGEIAATAPTPVDCESGCKAWQVTAHRDTPDPFNLQIWVKCTSGS